MIYTFKYKFVHMAPRKIRLVTNLVKNLNPEEAIAQLKFSAKQAGKPVLELLKSSLSCLKNMNLEIEKIRIKSLTCDKGPILKRRHYRSRGRAEIIRKKLSHITLELTDERISETQNSIIGHTQVAPRELKQVKSK